MRSLTLIVFFVCNCAHALTLEIDQRGGSAGGGGYGSPVVQTFMPAQDNIAGIDVLIGGSAVLTADVTVNVFSEADLASPLATATILDHPRGDIAEFRWEPVAVVPESVYRMQFIAGALLVVSHVSNTVDPYTRGNIIEADGNLNFAFEDALFTTYYDADFAPVPLPGAIWLIGAALAATLRYRRRPVG